MAALRNATQEALRQCGEKAVEYARQECPVQTGRLRDSISYTVSEGEVSVGSDVEYATYVELGTHKMAARPFLRPAMENHASEFAEIVKNSLKNG